MDVPINATDNAKDSTSNIPGVIAQELAIREQQVLAVLALFDEGCTVPFIARYRKEATGSLDETVITAIRDRNEKLLELEKRRAAILESLTEREVLTDELRDAILTAPTMTALEDLYLPFRPKRRTRASIAAEKGLTPLADLILTQAPDININTAAAAFVDPEKGVAAPDDALAGALDILAERVSEDPDARQDIRKLFARKAEIKSTCVKDKELEGAKYRDYFEWQEVAVSMPSHRLLAIFRGEREGFLAINIAPSDEEAIAILKSRFIKNFVKNSEPAFANELSRLVEAAVEDGYKRLLKRSMETELRNALKKRADGDAIKIFAENIKTVLMASPMGQKATLAIDPGIRTGCKVVCLSSQGDLLYHTVIFLQTSEKARQESEKILLELVKKYEIKAIAIGNGTAGRETESFVREIFSSNAPDIIIASVNESGASIYSASETARREFPDQDVTVRGAVSIGRRLMDPMAELVKIDPKSIGVGQYQHDVDQKELKQALDDVVIHCVNAVGVDVNTASPEILAYVSGLTKQTASQIVKYREANGPFATREAIKKVPRFGPKAFEQSAGFLRIHGGENPLDASAVHPENYATVARMAESLSCTVSDLMASADLRKKIKLEDFVTVIDADADSNGKGNGKGKLEVGLPTLRDIMAELEKPGRDPRDKFEAFAFDPNIRELADLASGMILNGIVTNVTAFGAFIDIGVHQDGLVHISRIADVYVENPNAHLKPGQHVRVIVLDVDIARSRISLSMRKSDIEGKKGEDRKSRDGGCENGRGDGSIETNVRTGAGRGDRADRVRRDSRDQYKYNRSGNREGARRGGRDDSLTMGSLFRDALVQNTRDGRNDKNDRNNRNGQGKRR